MTRGRITRAGSAAPRGQLSGPDASTDGRFRLSQLAVPDRP
jgi:hypothetical protein